MTTGALDGSGCSRPGCSSRARRRRRCWPSSGPTVTKVELPGFGDQARWLPMSARPTSAAPTSSAATGASAASPSTCAGPPASDVFLRLVDKADVVITNFKPGTMEAWGLGYDDLARPQPRPRVRPRLGVRAGRPRRPPGGRRPVGAGGGRADQRHRPRRRRADDRSASRSPTTSPRSSLVAGMLAALHARQRTGRGRSASTCRCSAARSGPRPASTRTTSRPVTCPAGPTPATR